MTGACEHATYLDCKEATISELIAILERIRAERGDVRVEAVEPDSGATGVLDVTYYPARKERGGFSWPAHIIISGEGEA